MMEIALKPDVRKPGFYVLREQKSGGTHPLNYRPSMRSPLWQPPTDVFETSEEVVVRVEIAGMIEADFTIILDGRNLFIRGVRPDSTERRAYHQMEIHFGEFGTDVELPGEVVFEQIQAVYNNGFLNIRLPKAKPKQVKIY
ncbi:MAG: Hsp20/alpha crystallin family protein [Anaerolineales bacterium]|nr:MAG: Hsp20/alpha crystallin family protein [Anaerolineales bacterium]